MYVYVVENVSKGINAKVRCNLHIYEDNVTWYFIITHYKGYIKLPIFLEQWYVCKQPTSPLVKSVTDGFVKSYHRSHYKQRLKNYVIRRLVNWQIIKVVSEERSACILRVEAVKDFIQTATSP
jgi:hypothetical protein